ncbi:MAG: methyltransferase domain-containing protein [Chloroflexota bacterium]
MGRRFIPLSTRRRIIRLTRWPPVGLVRFGSLRRLNPISLTWGTERGQPIDRYYIERFLTGQAGDIQGRVLEIGDNTYTRQFGQNRVTESVVLHVAEQKEHVTLIGSLTDQSSIPAASFDCLIVTQTLQLIYEVQTAIYTIYHSLKPGGVALVTVPGISQISRYDMDRWGHYWSFTTRSVEKLFTPVFPLDHLQIEAHGNVLAAISFLHGLASEELRTAELDHTDPNYQLLITIRAMRPKEDK